MVDKPVGHYGIVIPAEPGEPRDPADWLEVADVIEKPPPETVTSRLAIAARYVLAPEVFTALRATEILRHLSRTRAAPSRARPGAPRLRRRAAR